MGLQPKEKKNGNEKVNKNSRPKTKNGEQKIEVKGGRGLRLSANV